MQYEIYEPYAELGAEVIRKEPSLRWIGETDVRIGFLRSFKEKKHHGKLVFGECEKVKEQYKPFCPYDFLIIFYEENIVGFDERMLYALMHHELLHVGVNDNDGELAYRVNPHDVEEFDEIISRYGLHWAESGAGGGG